jgi:hypothetical protein
MTLADGRTSSAAVSASGLTWEDRAKLGFSYNDPPLPGRLGRICAVRLAPSPLPRTAKADDLSWQKRLVELQTAFAAIPPFNGAEGFDLRNAKVEFLPQRR